MQEIQANLNIHTNIKQHYKRKENLFFPYFEKKNKPGPPAVMWGKHDETSKKSVFIVKNPF